MKRAHLRGAAVRLAELADSKKAEETVRSTSATSSSYTDFLVICTARNERQGGGDHRRGPGAAEGRAENAARPGRGQGGAGWIVLDYLDCVLHVFTPPSASATSWRNVWHEAPRLELELELDEPADLGGPRHAASA